MNFSMHKLIGLLTILIGTTSLAQDSLYHELFNNGILFYSRRIVGAPLNYYSVDDLVEADVGTRRDPVRPRARPRR